MNSLSSFLYRFVRYIKCLFGKKPEFEQTNEFLRAFHVLNDTNKSVFITGKAGTGKSAFLRYFMKNTRKRYVIIAPTGVAAQNVEGRTIHSFFHFGRNVNPETLNENRILTEKLLKIDMVIIDEISMVRPDLMECVERSLRLNKHCEQPFGGLQMVFVGDLYQLPPVIKDEEESNIIRMYGGIFFFHAPVFQKGFYFEKIELTKVFRQDKKQSVFKDILNRIRIGDFLSEDLKILNERHESLVGEDNASMIITAYNDDAENTNKQKLAGLNGEPSVFKCIYDGDYKEMVNNQPEELPSPKEIELKYGAHIMMINNDSGHRWVNGSLGIVKDISQDIISVKLDNGKTLPVERYRWENKDSDGNITGTYTQFPMQLAYAITIHKSQGKTFNSLCINTGRGTWLPGHIYVALSRCRSLDKITLLSPILGSDIITDPTVEAFLRDGTIIRKCQPEYSIREKIEIASRENKRIKIVYTNLEGETKEHIVGNLSLLNTNKFKGRYPEDNHPRNFLFDSVRSVSII